MVQVLTDTELLGAITGWMSDQRWYAGKGHGLTSAAVLARAELGRVGDRQVSHLVVGVELDGSDWQVYQVPVLLAPQAGPDDRVIGEVAGGWLLDALVDPAAPALLLADVADRAELDAAASHAAPGSPPQLQALWDPAKYAQLPARAMSVEQSNTSIMLGSQALLKVFRRLIPGINPDVEVSAALAGVGCADIPALRGWINGTWTDPVSGVPAHGHLAMVQELLVPSIDGWDLSRARVAAGEDFATDSYRLGLATGSVHRDLRTVLPTHELGPDEVAGLVTRLQERFDRAAAVVPEVAELAPALSAVIARLRHLEDSIVVQRVHGDYHLGQVLLAGDGWKLLDFEGEPGGAIADRIVPDHPLRDVAAMLRSYDYAAHMGGAGRDPREVAAWRADCQAEFLRGYADAATDGLALDNPAARALLAAYTVDKTAYEAVYEKRNRPDWLPIPLTALRQIAARESGDQG